MRTRLAATACCLALGAAGLAGCADNRASVQIQAICYPTKDCTFGPTCDQEMFGVPGRNGAGSLVLFLQVANQLPNNESLDVGRLNTNDAHIEEAAISYEGAQTNTARHGENSYVPAGGSAIVPVVLYLTGTGDILAKVRLIGHHDDGRGFETGDFPIAVYQSAGYCPANACSTATTTCPSSGGSQCPVACDATSTSTGYTIGGTITGLTASGLVLSSGAGLADLTVSGGATSFTFAGTVSSGASYNVTVAGQPTGQNCQVTSGGSGTATANVTNITITCV